MKLTKISGRTSLFVVGSLAILGSLYLAGSTISHSQQSPQIVGSGWLEGTVHADDGRPMGDRYGSNTLHLVKDGQRIASIYPNRDMDGLYGFRDVRPGVYELQVDKYEKHKVLRYWGIVVAPGVRTKLNIIIPEGEGIQEIGQPSVATQSVIVISNEFARLQKEIDALKR